jgi:hypothetical protein
MKGRKSERFQYVSPVTGSIGPGSYDIDKVSRLAKIIAAKPTSKLGVAVTTACRFPDLKPDGPGAGQYEGTTFIDLLEHQSISLGSKTKNTSSCSFNIPGPGTYNPNYAIGRHVGNDHRFALTKSEWLKEKTIANRLTMCQMKELLKSNESCWEKRTGRRIAHLALYF